MSTALLDSFQLIVAGYLLYIAFKGNGQMYRFGNLSEADQAAVHKPLRILYAIGALLHWQNLGSPLLSLRCLPSSQQKQVRLLPKIFPSQAFLF